MTIAEIKGLDHEQDVNLKCTVLEMKLVDKLNLTVADGTGYIRVTNHAWSQFGRLQKIIWSYTVQCHMQDW